MSNIIFVKHNVPSSKNSKVNGKFFSPTVMRYLRAHGIQGFSSSKKTVKTYKTKPLLFPVENLKEMFLGVDYPVKVMFHFVRGSRHKWDFHNACQILLDLFTAFDIIPDDNMDFVIPECLFINGKHFSYDKENPGVWIEIVQI